MVHKYKHELEFIGIGAPSMYEICEPIGFDGLKFENEQEPKRFARSINFGALDTIEFVKAVGEQRPTSQIINELGDTSNFLNYGLEWLLYGLKVKGFELEVYYHLSLNGVYYPKMQLDFTEKDCTDGFNYVKCKLIDVSTIMDYKRQSDEKFNAFSDKDFKQRTITPIQTFNYLRRATPVQQISKWKLPNTVISLAGSGNAYNNFSQVNSDYGVENSLSWLDPTETNLVQAVNNIKVVRAKNDLTNVTVNIKQNIDINYKVTNPDSNSKMRMSLFWCVFNEPYTLGSAILHTAYDQSVVGSINQVVQINNYNDINFTVPLIERNQCFALFWSCSWDVTNLDNGNRGSFDFYKQEINITATSTAIDRVIKGVRYIDLIKQTSKVINNITVNAPKFSQGGEHYDQVCFNKRMISNKTDLMYFKPKDIFGSVEEVCCDYEIKRNEIYIDSFDKFYTNDEIGVFQIIPEKGYTRPYNDRFTLKSLKYRYQTYEQDRLVLGTSNAIHTESENSFPNYQVDGVKEISNVLVRDGYAIQSAIDLEIKQPSTSTSDDDKIYIEDMVSLAPSSFGSFGARLLMRVVGGNLEILNRDSNGDTNDVVFTWTGLGLGTQFEITQSTNGENVSTYTILSITDSILTLQSNSVPPTFSGDMYVKFKYFYSNVAYQTRTTQGVFLPINNFLCNIKYSIKRNILRWGQYLATAMRYSQSQIINTYFKSNGVFTSQLVGEINPIIENANINYSDLGTPILEPIIDNVSLVAKFNDVVTYMNNYDTQRGFIRCYDINGNVIKGYVQKSDFNPFSNEFNVTLERKYEPQTLTLTYLNGVLNLNGTDYVLGGNVNWWIINNDYFKFFDINSLPICNFYKFNFISLNGTTYTSALDLQNALLTL